MGGRPNGGPKQERGRAGGNEAGRGLSYRPTTPPRQRKPDVSCMGKTGWGKGAAVLNASLSTRAKGGIDYLLRGNGYAIGEQWSTVRKALG